MPISARVNASIQFTQTKAQDAGVVGAGRADLAVALAATLANGTANGQADLGFADERSLGSAANEDLDFAGSLLDVYGAVITAAEITGLIFVADPTNTTNLTLKPAAATSFLGPFGANTHTYLLKPGAAVLMYDPAGWTVGAGASDLFNVANAAGNSAKYKIGLLGRSS